MTIPEVINSMNEAVDGMSRLISLARKCRLKTTIGVYDREVYFVIGKGTSEQRRFDTPEDAIKYLEGIYNQQPTNKE